MANGSTNGGIERTIRIDAAPEVIFEALTTPELVERWLCHEAAVEPRLGGRIVETAPDGTEHLWGTVTAWEPPDRLAFTWHPGRTADTRQEVEITFLPDGDGARVSLVHSGWERLGERAADVRRNYEGGWGIVLGRYAD